MSVRLILTVLLSLSLMVPVAATGAMAAAVAAAAASTSMADSEELAVGQASGCHEAPPGEPSSLPPPTPMADDCCPGCDCDCGGPIGKGMAIGPGHLAGVAAGSPGAPSILSPATTAAGPSLRPPIGR